MKAFLVDISAFQIWFCDQGVIRTSNPLELVKDYRFATSSRAELPLEQNGRLGLRGQIHVAVPNHVRRHHQAGITAHVISSPTPYSFVRLSKDVYVESPEATLVRMASHLNRGELAVMINQLLSCYRICKGAIVKARPLSTKTQLLEQLDRFKGKRGAKKARRALTYAVAETASPAEAKVAALLTLPARWGGKGLPLPEANAEIVLTAPGHTRQQWWRTPAQLKSTPQKRMATRSSDTPIIFGRHGSSSSNTKAMHSTRHQKNSGRTAPAGPNCSGRATPWLHSPIDSSPILKSFPSLSTRFLKKWEGRIKPRKLKTTIQPKASSVARYSPTTLCSSELADAPFETTARINAAP